MRAAPPLAIDVTRFGAWRAMVAVLCALAAGVAVAEVSAHMEIHSVLVASPLAAWLAGGAAWRSSRRRPVSLRWDGRAWWSDAIKSPDGEPRSCELEVMIDLGNWLMLRLRPLQPPCRPLCWLPVQRRGLEPQWHALRAAAYSPRPRGEGAGAGVSPHE